MRKRWTTEEHEFLVRHYPHKGTEFCARTLNRSIQSIRGKTPRLGLLVTPERRRKAQRHNASLVEGKSKHIKASTFSECTTKEAAYVLGFLWADGFFLPKYGYKIGVHFKSSDGKDIIPIFRKTAKWLETHRPRRGQSSPSTTLQANDKAVWKFLDSHGYRSYRHMSPDSIISHVSTLAPYWFRGFFDGDGCFYYNKGRYLRHLSFAGRHDQDWSFLCTLLDNLGISYTVRQRTYGKNKFSVVRSSSTNDILLFGQYIYGNEYDGMGLHRKHDLFLRIIGLA